MPLEPKQRPAAERPFVDREEPITIFTAALKAPQRDKPLVLVFHGGAGTGKSRLRRELVKLVDSRQHTADRAVATATLDFDVPVHRQPEAALLALRNSLSEAGQVRFPSFDIAYAYSWQKAHPETPLRGKPGTVPQSASVELGAGQSPFSAESDLMPLLEPGSLLSRLLDDSGKLPVIGLIPKVSALVDSRQHSAYRDWWTERGERELEDLPQMEPGAIVECLPKLWASDLREFIVHRSSFIVGRSAVLFIDSYEKLWGIGDEGRRTRDEGQKTDAWVRELVKQLPEVLWVISGRQKLRWEEVEKEWADILSQHELGPLPEKSARQFLSGCGITNEPMRDAIAKGSQGLPHYLNLAVDTFQEIEQAGQRAGPVQSLFSGAESSDSPEQLFAQFIRHLDQPELATLEILSASRYWHYGLFEHLLTEYQTGYPLESYDDLSRFSFVGEGAAPETQTMHDLMREALQEHQAPELRKRVHLFLHEYYAKQLEGLDVKNITEQHKAALTEAFYHGRQAKSAEELWAWLRNPSRVFYNAGQYRLMIPLCREVVDTLEAKLGPDHPSVAEPLNELAANTFLQGGHDEAEPLFRRALVIADGESGPEPKVVISCLSHLAVLLRDQARYDEAEVLCRRQVAIRDKPGSSAIDRAKALGGLAAILIEQRKYTEAEEFLRRALGIFEEAPEPAPEYHADTLNTLGYLFDMQDRYAEAEPPFRRALAMSERTLGANHPDVIWPLGNLASVLTCLGRYAEAEPLFRRVLKLSEETLGPEHPGTAITLNKFGVLLFDLGRYAEAEAMMRRALTVFQKKMGPDNDNTFRIANRLTTMLAEGGNYAEAEPMALSLVASCGKKYGLDHPDTALALHTAGVVFGGEGRYAEAESYLRRAMDVRTRLFGPEHGNTLQSLASLAALEVQQGRYAEAESLTRDLLEKQERVLGPEHPGLATAANRLAGICCRDGRYAEAEALCRRALAIREKVFGPDHPFVAEPLEGLAKVCEKTGRASDAQELSARAKSIREKAAQAQPRT